MSNYKKHNEILEDIITEFRSKGFRVIHLNKKPIPDAIAIKDDKTVGIEVTASNLDTKIYSKKLKYTKFGFETDDLTIIAKSLSSVSKIPPEAYYYALELRKKDYGLDNIQKELESRFKVKISKPAISRWCKGDVKPLSVRNLERNQQN
jgi:Holliday junction resolvase